MRKPAPAAIVVLPVPPFPLTMCRVCRESREACYRDAGVGLVAPVDGDEVRGECLHLSRITKPAGIDATSTRYRGGEVADDRDRVTIIAEDRHRIGEVIDSSGRRGVPH